MILINKMGVTVEISDETLIKAYKESGFKEKTTVTINKPNQDNNTDKGQS